MFILGAATRIYLATVATDTRKRYEGLYGLMLARLQCEAALRSGIAASWLFLQLEDGSSTASDAYSDSCPATRHSTRARQDSNRSFLSLSFPHVSPCTRKELPLAGLTACHS